MSSSSSPSLSPKTAAICSKLLPDVSGTKKYENTDAVIVTCSALRHKYRDVLRIASYERPTVRVQFVHLKVDEQALQARVRARIGHDMKESMVCSQMKTLEEPAADETDVIQIDVQQDKDAVCKDALARILGRRLREH